MDKLIEVTPRMIDAGADEMLNHWTEFESLEPSTPAWGQLLAAVYRAMYLSRPQ